LTEITDNTGDKMSATYPLTIYFDASCRYVVKAVALSVINTYKERAS
jgi:hypothetical protein